MTAMTVVVSSKYCTIVMCTILLQFWNQSLVIDTSSSTMYQEFHVSSSYTAVHKTEVVKNTLSPSWREAHIPVSTLCNGDMARSLKVECYDWDSDGE